MSYGKALNLVKESISPEEMEKAINELPQYNTRREIVDVTIPGEMFSPAVLHAFAEFAEAILKNVPNATLEGFSIFVPQDREQMERTVISNAYYADKEKWEGMADD